MKKTITLLLLVFMLGSLFSQNYQCLYQDVEYSFSDGSNFKTVFFDTIYLEDGNSVFKNYTTIEDSNGWCFTRYASLWIGRKMIITPEGDNLFFNEDNEPITLKPYLNLNETWTCYIFSNGDYIDATIQGFTEDQFLGLTDSVKTIGFQKYDGNGTPANHSINDKHLIISKHYGFIQVLSFRYFPLGRETNLTGLSDPSVGTQNLRADLVYNFEPGDEFHTHSKYMWYNSNNSYDEYCLKKYVLNKEYSPNQDSVHYLIHRCGYLKEHHFNGNGYDIDYTYFNSDHSISYRIDFDIIINSLPDYVIIDSITDPWEYEYSYNTQGYFESTNRLLKINYDGYYSNEPHDCIWRWEYDEKLQYEEGYYQYIEGLGGPYYWRQTIYEFTKFYEPVYFKRGDEEWGTPYSFNCDSLPVNTGTLMKQDFEIIIAPNPMNYFTKISINFPAEHSTKISLYNIMGKIVREESTNEMTLRKGEIPSGIYLIRVFESDKLLGPKKLIVE